MIQLKQSKTFWGLVISVLLLAVACFFLIQKLNSSQFTANKAAEDFVLKNIKTPTTASFKDDFNFIEHGDGSVSVFKTCNAENGFGAMVTDRYLIKMKEVDGVWELLSIGLADE